MSGALELLFSLSVVSTNISVSVAQDPTASASGISTDEAQAKQAYTEGRYAEAASRYEALASSNPNPKFRFNAAMARELAGHEAHAYLHLRRYLALPSLLDAEREKGLARVNDLMQRTVPLRIQSTPGAALTLTLELKPGGAATDAGRVPLQAAPDMLKLMAVSGMPGVYEIYVEPGIWTISGAADGYRAERREITVSSNENPSLDLSLTPVSATAPTTANFSPSDAVAAGITVTVTGPSGSNQHVVPPSGELFLTLPAGTWTLHASASGFEPQSWNVTAAGEPQVFTFSLIPIAKSADRDPRQRFTHGLKIGGAVGLGLGLGVSVIGGVASQPGYSSLAGTCEDEFCFDAGAHREQRRTLWLYGSGAMVAGAGAAALAYGFVAGREPAGERWKTRLGVGITLATLGLAAVGVSYAVEGGLRDIVYAPPPGLTKGALGGWLSVNIAGFALIGSGVTLLVLSPIEHKFFAQEKLRARANVTPRLSVSDVGLNLNVGF